MEKEYLKLFGIKNIKVNLNSIGCPKCRGEYQKVLEEFIGKNLENYCDDCKNRFEKNPMRILDCKQEKCKKYNAGAPMMIDFLCDECKTHFENVKTALKAQNVNFEIDSGIVRGLDYYTKTVFEFIDEKSGLTVLGGGRYDGLVEELGGAHTPAVGFASGVERLMEMVNEAIGDEIKERKPDLYLLSTGIKENVKALELAESLRDNGFFVERDLMERSFKAQMKFADKIEARNLIVIGENELENGIVKIKNMATGEEQEVKLDVNEIISKLK